MDATSESSPILMEHACTIHSTYMSKMISSFKEFNNLLLCLVSLYLQMQLDAIKLIELNKLTWKLSSAFHPVCSNIHVAATL